MRVFVAGGTGAIGRPLVDRLAGQGHQVTVFTRSERRVADLGLPRVTAAVGDALVPDDVMRAVHAAQPEVVINQLTNLPTTASPLAAARGFSRTNRLRTEASTTLVRAARAAGARRVVAQSIAFIYRPGPGVRTEADPLWTDGRGPLGQIGRSVAALESATLGADLPEGVVLRYGAFYGPGTYYARDGLFSRLVARRLLPVPGGGDGLFGFLHLSDAVGATVAALDGPAGIFNVVDDGPAPTAEWLPYLATLLGAKPPRSVPEALARLVAGKYSAYLLCDQPAVSNRRARTELGWVPEYPDWRAGLAATLA
jgi:nucleoside-diphosphate-sugar epimerase